MSETERVATPEVSFSLSGERLTLRDEAGGGEVAVELAGEPSLTRATTSWFDVPMDAAVSFETEEFRIPDNIAVMLRDSAGEEYGMLTEQETEVDGDGTVIEVSSVTKIVAFVESGPVRGRIDRGPDRKTAVVSFDSPTRVVIGLRSIHEKPTATMTVPDDPTALMTAASHLGTSMKEWSAERSWPTLRGHPPRIERGDTLEIPDRLTTPDTGVSVAVPPRLESVLRVSPLAHYFGADVVPGDCPELRICGHAEPLGTGRTLERSVAELLARGIVLDSLVRIGGYYSLPRYEYDELAPELPFYPPELYDEPIDRQLLEYLEVPFELLAPHVPTWPGVGSLRPRWSDVEAVPSLLNSFARVRVVSDEQPATEPGLPSRAALRTAPDLPNRSSWIPARAREAGLAYHRRPQTDATISVVGSTPPAESTFSRTNWTAHGFDETAPTVDYYPELTTEELEQLFQEQPLYVHYDNRVTPDGFGCSDGVLPFEQLAPSSVGAISVVCDSENVAPFAGLFDVSPTAWIRSSPVRRQTVAAVGKYLLLGFPLTEAVRLAGPESEYRFLGDSSLSLADRSHGACPILFEVTAGETGYDVSFSVHNIGVDTLGSFGNPGIDRYDAGMPLTENVTPIRGEFTANALAELADDDHLFWFDCAVPDEFPTESVVHASREDWGDDTGDPASRSIHTDLSFDG